MFRLLPHFALFSALFLTSCASPGFTGFSYDPEGVEDTTDRETFPQYYRTIGFSGDGVWFSNEYDGSRMNDVYRVGPDHYRVVIDPENKPINNSPWYGFKVWSDEPAEITVELEYPESRQRYYPKISSDKKHWSPLAASRYENRGAEEPGVLNLELKGDTLWVSAQEIHTTTSFAGWLDGLKSRPFVSSQTVGYSHKGRPVKLVKIAESSPEPVKGVVILYGRQHPPEVPGYMVNLIFMETLAGDTELAQNFRRYFDVWAFPMMNPDGADEGHWRHNARGIDLNRDWHAFNQPETRAVRDALLPLKHRTNRRVFYGIDFHSTSSNIFYPIERSYKTFPRHFTYDWADRIMGEMPGLDMRVLPYDTSSPIAKNWTYHTFGADAVTFEVYDEIDRDKLKKLGRRSAEIFMEKMIDAYRNEIKITAGSIPDCTRLLSFTAK
jgi:cytosolic carboxypeptidase protein 6